MISSSKEHAGQWRHLSVGWSWMSFAMWHVKVSISASGEFLSGCFLPIPSSPLFKGGRADKPKNKQNKKEYDL
jgi:hypothetical protein